MKFLLGKYMYASNHIRIFLFAILVFYAEIGWSQLSKTHYIPPLTNAQFGNAIPETQYIYISTPSVSDINYTIKPIGQPASNYITGMVSNTNSQEIYIGTGNGQLFVPSLQTSMVSQDKGYVIEAEDVIYVSVRMNAGFSAQAGALVSKGASALGTTFRVGSYTNENPQNNYLNFVSVMATEDNTEVVFSDLPAGIDINNYTGSLPVTVTLNKHDSYIISINSFNTTVNRDGLIGCLVSSDKSIVVNCGSANGSFHNGNGRDYGIDQIVGLSKVGSEYIFVKGNGHIDWENVLIVAHSDNTTVSINGNTPVTTLNSGDYYLIEGDMYNAAGNMYVATSEPVFAYQGVGATNSEANQGLFFVPPLSCETRGNLNNIASIESIGSTNYTGGISIVTKKNAIVTIDNQPLTNFTSTGPSDVDGHPDYVTYKVTGLSGNTSVQSSDELYCAYFNYNGAATSGSFYSGFPTPPEINFEAAFVTLGICIPNIKLSVANMDNFDSIEWYYDDGTGFVATGVNTEEYTPVISGVYMLIGVMNCSNLTLESLKVPVSICPDDTDNDGIIDNIDIDNDNDGILNCTESYGDENIDLSNISGGSIPLGGYTYTGTLTTLGNVSPTPFTGNPDGTFTSEVPDKTGTVVTCVKYQLDFNKDLNLKIELTSSNASGNSQPTDEFVLQVPNTKTITVLDPDGQLLIDSNYDGIFESGITQFSSFEIRFKLNPASIGIGTYTFRFLTNSVDAFTYTHKNASNDESYNATFRISATCIAKDTDNDGIEDALDMDSDNDGIPDFVEVTGTINTLLNTDADADGLDDVYNLNTMPVDTDMDGLFDFYDLDSDNDGIHDLEETGSIGTFLSDTDINGLVDSPVIGLNGWVDTAETSPDSGIPAFILSDFDGDAVFSYIDSDSDGDLCSDVIEAGFSDLDENDQLGDNQVVVDSFGLVTNSGDGYSGAHINYQTTAIITIIDQPIDLPTCEFSEATFSINTNPIDAYQWQESTDGGFNWTDINNSAIYSGATTNILTISNVSMSYTQNKYRAHLDKNGNSCGLYSDGVELVVEPLPIVTSPVILKQCDDDIDGYSAFNLNEVNDEISTNANNESFNYFLTEAAARSGDITHSDYIATPTAFINGTVNTDQVWASVKSQFGCIQVSDIQLIVSTSKIPSNFNPQFYRCDDFLDTDGNNTAGNNDRDGISSFDFSAVDDDVRALFPVGQQIDVSYYRNITDALSELNEITDIANYRNIGYPNAQQIHIRVDNVLNNDCEGFGIIDLFVEELPLANPVTIGRLCDDDSSDNEVSALFDTSFLENDLILGQQGITVTYYDSNGNPLADYFGNAITSPFPPTFRTVSQTITVRVTNNNTNDPNGACLDEIEIPFTVDIAPLAYPVVIPPACDDDASVNDGLFDFDTTSIQSTILGSQTGMEIHYYDASGNQWTNGLPNPFPSGNQTITVEVINPSNTTCFATTSFDLIVNPIPEFEVESPVPICLTNPPSIISLQVYQNDPSELLDYEWITPSGGILNEVSPEVSESGTYQITLTKEDGTGCSVTKEILVFDSSIATIELSDLTIVDDSDNNTITINNQNNNLGAGDYEYALDNPYFSFQDEPFFENVAPGIHTVYAKDKNGCGMAELEISVLGYPKYFTPNNDGINDTWRVLGINEKFYTNASIYIFDRFGKLITQIDPKGLGWNGLFNGQILPATDYWFTVQMIDNEGNPKLRKGHFSLIRR